MERYGLCEQNGLKGKGNVRFGNHHVLNHLLKQLPAKEQA
jgi:hypothetical protein